MVHREFMLEFVRVTEDAAIASAHLVGHGDKHAADNAAVVAMRERMNSLDMRGVIVIGEGERDEAPMLFIGEQVGSGNGKEVDFAVDPLECTESVAFGKGNALAVLAAAPRGTVLHAPDTYMNKIAVGPKAKGRIDLDWTVEQNVKAVAKALGKDVHDVTVVVLDRDRHKQLIADIRAVGARILLISDGDVSGAIAPSLEDSGIDMLLGIGAAPEGVLAAAALRCLGGEMQCRFKFRNDEERGRALKMGVTDPEKKMHVHDLVRSDDCLFIATGVTDGSLLRGVKFGAKSITTHSLIMRSKTKTLRFIETIHERK
jgi:fructose-1,6-bisphosphatase II